MQDYIEHGLDIVDTLESSKQGGSFNSGGDETPKGATKPLPKDVQRTSEHKRRDKAANMPAKGGCGDEACCIIF